jgi:hypothetical protein
MAGHSAKSLTAAFSGKLSPQDQLAAGTMEKLPIPDPNALLRFARECEEAAKQLGDDLADGLGEPNRSKQTLPCKSAEPIYLALTILQELLNATDSLPRVEDSGFPHLREAKNAQAEARFLIESFFRKT